MDPATQSRIDAIRALAPEQRAQLSDDDLAQIEAFLLAAKYEGIEALCRREEASFDCGPLLWLTQLTKTENPQHELQGLPFLAGFPRKTYFEHLFGAFLARHPMLAVPKSRTMMTSWAAAAYAAWTAQWKGEETLIQAHNEDKAQHLIDYVRQLVDHQEPWISSLHPIHKRSTFAIAWKDGGEVAAIPGGANAVRAFHPTTFIMDEASFVVDGEQSLNAVLPTGAKIILISTAAPGWFGDMCSDMCSD